MAERQLAILQDDRDLMAAAIAGDRSAFEAVYRRYQAPLAGYVRTLIRDASVTDELVQETFLRAWKHVASFDPSRKVWPWLQTIAQRLAYDHVDGSRHARETEDRVARTLARTQTIALDDVVVQREEGRTLGRAMRTLSPRYQRLLLLFAVEGWSYRQLAEADGSSVTSVAKVICRARAHLRRAMPQGDRAALAWFLPVAHAFENLYVRVRARIARLNPSRSDSAQALQGLSIAFAGAVTAAVMAMGSQHVAPVDAPGISEDGIQQVAAMTYRTAASVGGSARGALNPGTSGWSEEGMIRLRTGDPAGQKDVDPTDGHLEVELYDNHGKPIVRFAERHDCLRTGTVSPHVGADGARC